MQFVAAMCHLKFFNVSPLVALIPVVSAPWGLENDIELENKGCDQTWPDNCSSAEQL